IKQNTSGVASPPPLMEYRPVASVAVPTLLPFTRTLTPGMPFPPESVTLPEIVRCACTEKLTSTKHHTSAIIGYRCFIDDWVFSCLKLKMKSLYAACAHSRMCCCDFRRQRLKIFC